MSIGKNRISRLLAMGGLIAASGAALAAQPEATGTEPLPPAAAQMAPAEAAPATPAPTPAPAPAPAPFWSLTDAGTLLAAIEGISAEGLVPADYQPAALRAAIAAGEGEALNAVATRAFTWLAEDLRDGRTPMAARVQWFVVDPDIEATPTEALLATALETHDVAGVLAGLAPTHPDYAALKAALATTPRAEARTRALIRVNMDRWRWLARDLGHQYLITNVPEFQLRLTVADKIVRTYRTIVGKPGRTATPQLAEEVEGVIFNPTWTVPQSIVVGEGLGARLLGNPGSARSEGYAVTRAADGYVSVVQQPGPNNALGLMKLDMPNPHAIFLHDTPGRHLFASPNRALSHGCIRTERATELAITLAILQAGMAPEQAVGIVTSGEYTRVPFVKKLPVYITYFTMARDITGELKTFADLYGRDASVLASFNQPRQPKTGQRTSTEEVIILDNPL